MAKRKAVKVEPVVGVIDCETDPFLGGRVPKPFAWGVYWMDGDAVKYSEFWGDDCTAQLVRWLAVMPPFILYAHNGGKFDFHFLLADLTNPLMIMDNRIAKCGLGEHELRDSFCILPFGLGKYQKTKIDYTKFERETREEHKTEICDYLRDDCKFLYELVTAFRAEFGDALTMAGAAMRELSERHFVEPMNRKQDQRFREFYHGGRCQFFESGVMRGKWKIYDVNSMYPYSMKAFMHPCIAEPRMVETPSRDADKVSFILWRGMSHGALPQPAKMSLEFPHEAGQFQTCSHEFFAAMDLGLIEVDKILDVREFDAKPFTLFVDHFYNARIQADLDQDLIHKLFYKFILNGAYGKFAMNPDEFESWCICNPFEFPDDYDEDDLEGWQLRFAGPLCWFFAMPAPGHKRYNVATAASITSAARSVLMRGLKAAHRPVYCDTDSIICEGFDIPEDSKTLGGWKLEAEGDKLAVAGRKLYALMNGQEVVKQASKGCRISAAEIFDVARGKVIEWVNEVPSFGITHEPNFIKRNIRRRV